MANQTSGESINVSISNEHICRIKSAMVLYALEMALGDLVAAKQSISNEINHNLVAPIVSREAEKGRFVNIQNIKSIIQSTYINEVLALAEDLFRGEVEEKNLSRLRQLFELLDAFSIRNAISHPNRPFPYFYWHRVAAIASDPAIAKLGLRPVIESLAAAESGSLAAPPEEWMQARRWELPNNLPNQFDHDVTGLVGRKQEAEKLDKLLQNQRLNLIAVVGPGGVGKTALLLHVLDDARQSPDSTKWTDQILYFSAKLEHLTREGVKRINAAIDSLDGIKSAIVSVLGEPNSKADLDDIFEKYANNRILLCLDNLETLLRDQAELFEDFYQSLPKNWRVVVTSRVSVNSATTMPLAPLSPAGAQSLARVCLAKRGGQQISEDLVKSVVTACDYNPLAIRLVIDGFIAGNSLDNVLSTTKKQILEFSYTNLIDRLSKPANEILECLFAFPEALDRVTACTLLEREADEIAEAFRELGGTALVTREVLANVERYSLSPSVRDLLLLNPRDPNLRVKIASSIKRIRINATKLTKYQHSESVSPAEIAYTHESTPEYVKSIVSEAISAIRRNDKNNLHRILDRARQSLRAEPTDGILLRICGVILLELGDRVQGKEMLQRSARSPSVDIPATLRLCEELRNDQELEDSLEAAQILIDHRMDRPEVSDESVARSVLKAFWLPQIWLGNTEEVIAALRDWRTRGPLKSRAGSLYAQALRNSAETKFHLDKNHPNRQLNIATDELVEAASVWDEVIITDGYTGAISNEVMKLIETSGKAVRFGAIRNPEAARKLVDFVDKHIVSLCNVHSDISLDHAELRQWLILLSQLPIEGASNVLTSRLWRQRIGGGFPLDAELETDTDDWIALHVCNRPPDRFRPAGYAPYLFATAEDGTTFYVNRSNMDDRRVWNQIRSGDIIFAKPDDGHDPARRSVLQARWKPSQGE